MEFIKWMDNLPQVAKIVIAIIPFCDLLWLVYRIIKDVTGSKMVALILDIVGLFVGIGGFICWIMDIIDTITQNRPFNWGDWIKA
jgi:hypothetical protein